MNSQNEWLFSLEECVELVVLRTIVAGLDFTAYDVTKAIRGFVDDVKVYHHEVKELVHVMFRNGAMGDYIRVLGERGGNQCFVYTLPEADDLEDVLDEDTGEDDEGPKFGNGEVYKNLIKDNRGRLCIPAAAVGFLGANPGDTLYVRNCYGEDTPVLEIGVDMIESHFTYGYVVDKDRNIRISESVLDAARLTGEVFNVEEATSDDDLFHLYVVNV